MPGKILGLGECRSTVSVHIILLLASELPAGYLLCLSTDGGKEWQKGITKENKGDGRQTLTVCMEYYPQMHLLSAGFVSKLYSMLFCVSLVCKHNFASLLLAGIRWNKTELSSCILLILIPFPFTNYRSRYDN